MITRLNREALPRLSGSLQSVRFARKRTPEYPNYKAKLVPLSHKDKDHSGFFERHLKAWLGPKNIAGEYYMNKYYYVKQDNIPNYIVPDGKTLVSSNEPTNYRGVSGRDPHLHPFPHNPACKTASILTDDMKRAIFVDKTEKGLLAEELAQKYQLKLARIEAIVSLQKIKNTWEKEVCFRFTSPFDMPRNDLLPYDDDHMISLEDTFMVNNISSRTEVCQPVVPKGFTFFTFSFYPLKLLTSRTK